MLCTISVCANVCVSAKICTFCVFPLALFFPVHLFILSYLALFVFIQPYYYCSCFNACLLSNERKQSRMWIWVGEEDLGRAVRGETVININCMESIYFQ